MVLVNKEKLGDFAGVLVLLQVAIWLLQGALWVAWWTGNSAEILEAAVDDHYSIWVPLMILVAVLAYQARQAGKVRPLKYGPNRFIEVMTFALFVFQLIFWVVKGLLFGLDYFDSVPLVWDFAENHYFAWVPLVLAFVIAISIGGHKDPAGEARPPE